MHRLSKDDLLPIHLPVKVSMYTNVTFGFSEDDWMTDCPCQCSHLHQSNLYHPWTFQGWPTASTPPCQSICVHQSNLGHPQTFQGWPIASTPPCQSIHVHQSYLGLSEDDLLPVPINVKVSVYTKVTLDIHRISVDDLLLVLLPVKVAMYTKDIHGLSLDCPLPIYLSVKCIPGQSQYDPLTNPPSMYSNAPKSHWNYPWMVHCQYPPVRVSMYMYIKVTFDIHWRLSKDI